MLLSFTPYLILSYSSFSLLAFLLPAWVLNECWANVQLGVLDWE